MCVGMNEKHTELAGLELGKLGKNVEIHRPAISLNPAAVQFGDHRRIDCSCFRSAGSLGLEIGKRRGRPSCHRRQPLPIHQDAKP
jgi:hypothetical protein